MKKLYVFFTLLIVSLFVKMADAQDANFSQFYYHEAYYNPAMSGMNNGLRAVLTDRQFWTAVPGTYRSSYLNVEYYDNFFKQSAVGLNILNTAKGESFLKSTRISACYSKRFYFGPVQFQFGWAPAYVLNRIDYSNLVFPDELDPRLGRIYETEFVPGETKKNYLDLWNVGMVGRFNIMQNSTKALATNTFGFSIHHFSQPDEGFMANSDDKLPFKLDIHWYSFFKISRNGFYNSHFYVAPGVLYENQKLRENFFKSDQSGFKTMSFGANAIIPSRLSFMSQLYTGLWVRKQFYKSVTLSDVSSSIKNKQFDALILTLGVIKYSRDGKQNFRLMYSYDMTISNATLRTGGTHEVILAIEISDLALPGGKRSWGYVKNPADRFFHMGTGR